jgi:hypothetical protein
MIVVVVVVVAVAVVAAAVVVVVVVAAAVFAVVAVVALVGFGCRWRDWRHRDSALHLIFFCRCFLFFYHLQ